MFGIIPKKRLLVYAETVKGLLSMQFALGRQVEHMAQKCLDPWIAGYVWGAHCGLLRSWGMTKGKVSAAYLKASYGDLLFDKEVGLTLMSVSMNSSLQSDAVFDEGNQVGGNDVIQWLKTKGPPMKLARYLMTDVADHGA